MKLPEFLKLPSTKRKEAEAKRLKEESYIKAEEARQERAAKQRQQMSEYYEETRKRRESSYEAVENPFHYNFVDTSRSYPQAKNTAQLFSSSSEGTFSGGGSSSSWNSSDTSSSYSSSDSCSSSSDSSSCSSSGD